MEAILRFYVPCDILPRPPPCSERKTLVVSFVHSEEAHLFELQGTPMTRGRFPVYRSKSQELPGERIPGLSRMSGWDHHKA